MADYKDYIVRYTIQSNTKEAADGLSALAANVERMVGPMQELTKTAQGLASAIQSLRDISTLKFTPEVDTSRFQFHLDSMVEDARKAALEINKALYGSLSKKMPLNATVNDAKERKYKTSDFKSKKQITDRIAEATKRVDEFRSKYNAKGSRVELGLLQLAKNSDDESKKNQAEATLKYWKNELDELNNVLGEYEKMQRLQKETIATNKKLNKDVVASKSTTNKSATQSKNNNLTPAIIREWKNAFGDAKSRTLNLNIKAKADEAFATINRVKESLDKLKAASEFTIRPMLHMEGFAAAERKMKGLAELSNAVVAPFMPKTIQEQKPVAKKIASADKKQLQIAKQSLDEYNQEMQKIQSRLDRNELKYKENPSRGLKGQITKDTNALNELKKKRSEVEGQISSIQEKTRPQIRSNANKTKPLVIDILGRLKGFEITGKIPTLPVNVKILRQQIVQSLNAIRTPALKVDVKLNAQSMQGQVNALAGKQKADAERANISVGGKLDKKGILEQIKAIPRQTLPMYVKLSWERGVIGKQEQFKKITSGVPPIALKLDISAAVTSLQEFVSLVNSKSPQNIALRASGNAVTEYSRTTSEAIPGRSIVPSRAISEHPAVEKYEKQKELALKNSAKKKADGRFLVQKAHEYQQKDENWHQYQQSLYDRLFGIPKYEDDWTVQAERKRAGELVQMKEDAKNAFSKLTPFEQSVNAARQKSVEESLSRHQRAAESLRTKALNSVLPFADSKEQAKLMVENRKFLKDAMFLNGVDPSNYASYDTSKKLDVLRDARTLMEMKNAGVPMPLQNQIKKFENEVEQQKLMQRKQESANSIARHQKLADMLRAKAYNAFMPYVESKEQARMLVENRKFFKKAVDQSALIIPRKAMPWSAPTWKKTHLQEVENMMIAANKPVPWQLHDQINKFDEQAKKIKERQKSKRSAESISRHAKQAERLRAQAYNSVSGYVDNKEQAKALVKYRKFFNDALKKNGIGSYNDLSLSEKHSYLGDVIQRMESSKVEVPHQLRKKYAKIGVQMQNELEQAGGGSGNGGRGGRNRFGGGSYEKPFFDRSRKWAFPFTGPTSFGTNTPMAVEMAKGMGTAYAIEGAMSVIGSSFGQAVDYQNVMSTTQAILQNGTDSYTNDSFKEMERTVRNVGVKTKFSAPEVAEAAKFLAMAGYDIDAINKSIRPIADLALIGDSDLGETADKMTNIMTTFQIAPEKMRAAANIMATTAMRSNTDLMMLAESAKYGGGVANLYGRNDPNLFADTMALFGVMGNAGIQASSAGTALRMMYQNIFNPNKKQRKILDAIKSKYGVTTYNDDGSYRSLSSILIDMSQNIPEDVMAEVVGKLFRITAQPGANAALLAAAGGDANVAKEIGRGSDAIADRMSSKEGLSTLISLMTANRESASGSISNTIAEKKQNTIQGLWAQVTSTFTEVVLRSFEAKKDVFEEMLRGLRDYFAKPETLRTMQVFMDAIIDIGKTMATFAKIWADIYSTAPGLIATWIKLQLFFTQVGALISPLVSLIGVFDRLKGAIISMVGASKAGAVAGEMSKFAQAMLATKEKFGIPISMVGSNGEQFSVRGGAAMRAAQAMKQNEQLADELALSGAIKEEILEKLNDEVSEYYEKVRGRAKSIYGKNRFNNSFKAARTASYGSLFFPVVTSLKSIFNSLMTGFAKALGFLANPITLAIGAISALGLGIYKFFNIVTGNTNAQIEVQEKLAQQAADSARAMIDNSKWYDEQLEKFKKTPQTLESVKKSEAEQRQDVKEKRFNDEFWSFVSGFSEIDNEKALKQHLNSWMNRIDSNVLYKIALGDDYVKDLQGQMNSFDNTIQASSFGTALIPAGGFFGQKTIAKRLRDTFGLVGVLRAAAVNDEKLPYFIENISELYKKYGATEEYYKEANKLMYSLVNPYDPKLRSLSSLSPGQKITNPEYFKVYQEALQRLFSAFIYGVEGTPIAKMESYNSLKNSQKDVDGFLDYWQPSIRNVIGDYQIPYSVLSESGKNENIKLKLSLLPDGKINVQWIVDQVREVIENFNLGIEDYVNILSYLYKLMANDGLLPDTQHGAFNWIEYQTKGWNISKNDAVGYWSRYLPSNSWVKSVNLMPHEYADWVTGNKSVVAGGKEKNPSTERAAIVNDLTSRAVNKYYGDKNAKKLLDAVPYAPGMAQTGSNGKDGANTNNNGTNGGGKNKLGIEEDPYKSRYSSQSLRPTQISISINELVHFDRTVVASSADEKDMIDAMENKITEAVYKIFAEASNQAQKVIDIN